MTQVKNLKQFDNSVVHNLIRHMVQGQTDIVVNVDYEFIGKYIPSYEPVYGSDGASGADLKADLDHIRLIKPYSSMLVPTGIRLKMSAGIEAQVRSRSGLAAKNNVFVLNSPGTIDSDYRGELKVILYNAGQDHFSVTPEMRIAQLVFAPVLRAHFTLGQIDLDDTKRGENGFGSTGTK